MTPTTLKAARAGLGITQADLAMKAGVHPKTIANFEQGIHRKNAPTMPKIEAALESMGAIISAETVSFIPSHSQ